MFTQKRWHYSVGVCLVMITIALIVWLLATPASAYLGNSGIPVRCIPSAPGGVIPEGADARFNCVAADGTAFVQGQSVPAGYYFLVTDVVITPERLTTVDTAHRVVIRDREANGDMMAELHLEVFRSETRSVNFSTPFLVLNSGHHLTGQHFSMDSFGINVHVAGLLVTNVTYFPGVTSN